MAKKVKVVVVGINGYGNVYIHALLRRNDSAIVGVVDIKPESSPYYDQLKEGGIPIFASLHEFYEQKQADLAIICTPIHLHTTQSVEALKHGSHVLCEKPMTASSQDFELWDEAVKESGKWAAIGFNWSFYETILALKRDQIAGKLGKAKSLRTLVFWPRDDTYFNRSHWVGKCYSVQGDPVFDSVANNAAAHFLHNMLYVLGDEMEACAAPTKVEADLYKANPIETFDTCAIRVETAEGAELLFYASHATEQEVGPMFEFEFEHATVKYECKKDTGQVIAYFHNGVTRAYGSLEVNQKEALKKLATCIEAVRDSSKIVPCTHETAKAHVQVIESLFGQPVKRFATEKVELNEGQYTVKGLLEIVFECYQVPTHSMSVFNPLTKRLEA